VSFPAGAPDKARKGRESIVLLALLDPLPDGHEAVAGDDTGSIGRSATEARFFHFATVFWLMPCRFARTLRLS
jgi:hypothetical protein